MRSIDERCNSGPKFRALVIYFENFFRQSVFTPSEIREAAMLIMK